MNTENPEQTSNKPYQGLKVLAADDDTVILEFLRKICEILGFQVFTARDGQTAWEIYQSEKPDLVFSDIYMPRMNGIFLLKRIKEHNLDCLVVLITGFSHYKQLVDKGDIVPDGFLTKPFDIKTMVTTIQNLLKERLVT